MVSSTRPYCTADYTLTSLIYCVEDNVSGRKRKADASIRFTFVDINKGGAGKTWNKDVQCGYDFFPEAKQYITRSWNLQTAHTVLHLACYVSGVDGPVHLEDAHGYWRVQPSSNMIFFWVGEKQDSPARRD